MKKQSAAEILAIGAKTFAARRAIYGDNWRRAGNALQALFPNGVAMKTADDHARFHILSLIVVKLSRYAVAYDRGERHQDSTHDGMVYSAMLEAIDNEVFDAGNKSGLRKVARSNRKGERKNSRRSGKRQAQSVARRSGF